MTDLVPYGPPITAEEAKKLIAIAVSEATKRRWPVAVAVMDCGGHLVAFEKMDNTQLASIEIALAKTKCAVLFRRPTKVFQDALISGGAGNRVLNIPGIIPLDGAMPIIVDGHIIGGIGVSGMKPDEDAEIVQAALDSLHVNRRSAG